MAELLEALTTGIGAAAQHLRVVLDGLIVHVNLFGDPGAVDMAWAQVETMLRGAVQAMLVKGALGTRSAPGRV